MTAAYLQLFFNTTLLKNIDSGLWRPSEVGIPVRPTESVVFVTKYAQDMTSKSSRCLGNHLKHRKNHFRSDFGNWRTKQIVCVRGPFEGNLEVFAQWWTFVRCLDIKHVSHWLNKELKFYRIFRKLMHDRSNLAQKSSWRTMNVFEC